MQPVFTEKKYIAVPTAKNDPIIVWLTKPIINYCVMNFVLCETTNCQLLRAFHPSSAIQLLCKSKPLFGVSLIASV